MSVGHVSSAAIKTDGTLWTWGTNTQGHLWHGNTVSRSSPVQVGSLTNWKQVAISHSTISAIKTDGTLWSTIGLGDIIYRSSPVQVGSLTNWKQISSSLNSLVAIKTDGTLWACGYNGNGQLGLGDTAHRSSPVQVGTSTNWKFAAVESVMVSIQDNLPGL